ncbi:multidrug effflux MFS transporter [Salibaculum griseiflavum]|jgi:DHA1 family bicyclomycin/chloramphenicol resistance-like MFS transporter|uniref:Bcr/CflA family efflux transporter n=1 Tax=Salibaculum griseiflavum TaxID=1914409 RepID=A0A2V1P0V8_9RHOB|nr:multidrug effflux MFS transporter [Salibaculum griseiflavum]PWG16006.1 Bcr/CflA family drug resistance efflux transporter [Salibaculum griseiflavum]
MTTSPDVRFLDRRTAPHLLTLILLAGIPALNMSIFLPSLNGMAVYFQADYAVMQLAVSGYLAATAILQVGIGPLADRYGRRPMILGALSLFLVATIGTILSPTVEVFLAFRLLQAAVATAMVLSRAIVRDMVPDAEAASMIGYVTMGMALVPMIGPAIGGALDQLFDWHASFVFLAVAGAAVLALAYYDLGETVAGSGMDFRAQMRTYPELLTSPRFWGYVACAAFGSGAFFALLGGASFVAGEVFGLSPFWAGIALGSPAIGYAIGNGISGRFSVRIGIDRMILIGTLIAGAGMGASLIVSLLGYSHPLLFFGFCTSLGLGNGIMLPNATAGSLSVRPHLAGTASGLGGAIMIGGGAFLSAIAGSLLTEQTGALPLQAIMFVTSVLATGSILLVMRRTAKLSR